MATPEWLAIVEEEIIMRLDPQVLTQVEKDTLGFTDRHDHDVEIIYKLRSQDLLQVLASGVGVKALSKGAIVIWTYYSEPSNKSDLSEPDPILRTLMNIDGDMSQKVCLDLLQHPLSDRILKAHSFIVGQISRQLITAIDDYVEMKLRPLVIASISMVTVFAWCEPLQNLGKKLNLPEAVIGNCWSIVIAAPITMLLSFWLVSKLPFQLPDLPKSARDFGKSLLVILESRIFQIVAISIIVILLLCGLAIRFADFPVDAQIGRIIHNIQLYADPYLPIAIISLRKLIISNLGKIFLRSAFFVKLLFGRFIR